MRKLFLTILLSLCSVLMYAQQVDSPLLSEEAKYVMQAAGRLYESVNDDQSVDKQLYTLSMVVLANVAVDNDFQYQITRNDMMALFLEHALDNKRAWLLGRLILAASEMSDQEHLAALKKTLQKYLSHAQDVDYYTAWAYAYLMASDNQLYQRYKVEMSKQLDALLKADDAEPHASESLVWVFAMDFYAAAKNRDVLTYQALKQKMLKRLSVSRVDELIRAVPNADYRQWLIRILMWSSQRVGERPVFKSQYLLTNDEMMTSKPDDPVSLMAIAQSVENHKSFQ